jgi:superfamily II DNA or RNA helicase
VNVGVLCEGFDFPAVSCVILARSVGTCGLFLQISGRGLRPSPGKPHMTLLDLSGATHLHGSPDSDREYSLTGQAIRQAGVEMPTGTLCSICGNPPPCECGGREQTEIAVTGSVRDLKPWIAAMRKEPDDQRAIRLARWFREAERKGWKEGAARQKFRAVYDHYPTTDIINAALRLCATKPAEPPPPAQTSLLENAS